MSNIIIPLNNALQIIRGAIQRSNPDKPTDRFLPADHRGAGWWDNSPPYPDSYNALFEEGERGALLENMVTIPDDEFDALVEEGSISEDGRQTRYFRVDPHSGDGLIVTDFVIEGASSGPLSGDNRSLDNNPLSSEYGLDDSRMMIIIDHETGRGMVTVSPSSVDVNIPLFPDIDIDRGALPITFDKPYDQHRENYFNISSSEDGIRINYDAMNSITAFSGTFSVDGTFVLERGEDGLLYEGDRTDVDDYPARVITQYLPDGSQNVVFEDKGRSFLGAIPSADEIKKDVAEGGINVVRETGELWNKAWDAIF